MESKILVNSIIHASLCIQFIAWSHKSEWNIWMVLPKRQGDSSSRTRKYAFNENTLLAHGWPLYHTIWKQITTNFYGRFQQDSYSGHPKMVPLWTLPCEKLRNSLEFHVKMIKIDLLKNMICEKKELKYNILSWSFLAWTIFCHERIFWSKKCKS